MTAGPAIAAQSDVGTSLLCLDGVGKQYPGVRALDAISLDLLPGEVHVLLGENGAGKSTLMKILSGEQTPDQGSIFVRDQPVEDLTPDSAQALGIGLVHQELSLVPALSVAENISLGHLPRGRFGRVDWAEAHRLARDALSVLGVEIDTRATTDSLEVAEQQLVEIARVLSNRPEILLLDEPTSALSDAERNRLFAVIDRLKARGVGIIYISHHLSEVGLIADRVTVLRDGRLVATLAASETTEDGLVGMMVGRQLLDQFPKIEVDIGEPVLEASDLQLDGVLHGVSLTLRRGEILGVFGLMGAGQAELARLLFGLDNATGGSIRINGRSVTLSTPADAIANGLGLIYRDRRRSLVPMLAAPQNLSLAWLANRSIWWRLPHRREAAETGRYIDELRIQPPSLTRQLLYYSGGNQQKVVLARWMSSGAGILIFDEPTRGIDVGAKAEVFALMSRLVRDGASILMISSEMSELIGMADRVLVMRSGRVAMELQRDALTQERLLQHAS